MTPEQIGAVLTGATGLVTVVGGIILTLITRRDRGAADDRRELAARDTHDDAVARWRVQIRAYIARQREQLADCGVQTDDPPSWPERDGAATATAPKDSPS